MTAKRTVGTIDMTPTWEGLLPTLLHVYANAESAKGQIAALEELTRMARIADAYVAEKKGS